MRVQWNLGVFECGVVNPGPVDLGVPGVPRLLPFSAPPVPRSSCHGSGRLPLLRESRLSARYTPRASGVPGLRAAARKPRWPEPEWTLRTSPAETLPEPVLIGISKSINAKAGRGPLKTLARGSRAVVFRQVVECGGPAPLWAGAARSCCSHPASSPQSPGKSDRFQPVLRAYAEGGHSKTLREMLSAVFGLGGD